MVATIKSISSASNAGKYFYWTEKDCECARGWQNTKGCQLLQLNQLNREDLEDVLEGRINEDGKQIQLGRREEGQIVHRPGQELILSAPKSVSIMALVAGDERILDAHEEAVKNVVDYIEQNMVYTRVQEKGNMMFEKTDNMVAAKFTHITARIAKNDETHIPDPQLHTHCIVGNMTKCKDGMWRSIVFDKFYDNKMHIGELYRMELAHGLKELGYKLNLVKDKSNHWTFEIKGLSEKDLETFSKRRADILEAAKEMRRDDAEGLAYIAKTTRGNKIECKRNELQQSWEGQVPSLINLQQIIYDTKIAEKSQNHVDLKKEISHAINVLSDKEAVFFKEKLIAEIVNHTKENSIISVIEGGISNFIEKGNLKESNNHTNTFTTPANLKAEKEVVQLMHNLQNKTQPIISKDAVYRELLDVQLTVGQKNAVVTILNTSDRVVGIQGSAGTGKTTVLQYVSQIAATKDRVLIGLSPTKAAANTMEQASGIEASTLDKFLLQYNGVLAERGTQDGMHKMQTAFSNKIIVLDEASLVSTDKMSKLLKLSDKLNFRTVLIGDTKQLGSIEAGKPFYYLQQAGLNTVTMDNTKRQKNESLRQTVQLTSQNIDASDFSRNAEKIFKSLGTEGIIEIGSGATNSAFADAIYNKWKEYHSNAQNALIVVPSNSMRREVNTRIRPHFVRGQNFTHNVLHNKLLTNTQLKDINNYNIGDVLLFTKTGEYAEITDKKDVSLIIEHNNTTKEVDPSALSKKIQLFDKRTLQLALSERIRFTKNSKNNTNIINGKEATITSISQNKITFEMSDGSKIKMNKNDPDLQHIDHNYSSTTYGAQGATVDHVIGVARAREQFLDLSTQRSLYVTLSRAKHSAIIFTENKDALARSLSKKSGAKTSAIEHQQEKRLKEYPVDLQRQGREVFIGLQKEAKSSKITQTFTTSHSQSYENFVSNPGLIRDTAEKIFGDVNSKLSKHHQLRFGNKGSVSVNLQSGQWYDFSTGEGGNLYKFCKNEVTFEKKTNTDPIKANGQSTIQKLIAIERILRNSIPATDPKASPLHKYFSQYRNINLKEITLSDDLRFSDKIWNSEKKKYMPAVIAVARNKNGKVSAVQVTYLNSTSDKARNLSVSKRSIGLVKGSFVELTKNTNAITVFIAEGIETALSIAQAKSDACIICSLGISNIRNIELSSLQHKNVVICADNDGPNSQTNLVIERAAASLKENGAKSVTIIRPDKEKSDFNDLLKTGGKIAVKQYTAIAQRNHNPLYKQIQDLRQNSNYHKINGLAIKNKIFANYKDPAVAEKNWDVLKQKHGLIAAIEKIIKQPSILGKMHGGFFNNTAKENIKNNVEKLTTIEMHNKLQNLQQKNLQQLNNKLNSVVNSALTTKDFTSAMRALHNTTDHTHVKWTAERFTEQVSAHKSRYNTEPTQKQKAAFFLRTVHEFSRKGDLKKYATSNQHLDRLVAIDYTAPNLSITLELFRVSERTIRTLTQEYISQGMHPIKALFVAKEVITYNDKHCSHMPTKQIDFVKSVGDYVHRNYNDLRRFGFSHKEALITYKEGSTLVSKYDASSFAPSVSKADVKQAQAVSKQRLERGRTIDKSITVNPSLKQSTSTSIEPLGL